ncbi:MAG TPA: MM0924 family protein [Aridibacter sp.]|nr:MM0924 family protein [Aridibacter sp.]
MEERLKGLEGKNIDVSFGNTTVVRGKVANVSDGILSLDDEKGNCVFVAVDKIVFFVEVKDSDQKPGFVSRPD